MHPHQRPSGHRYQNHHSVTRKTSFSDDDDAITPCSSPPPEPQELECSATNRTSTSLASFRTTPMLHQHKSLAPTPSSRTTMSTSMRTRHFDPTDGQDMTDSQLWQRMLEIQRTFHCYNSARMSAALLELEMGVDAGHLAQVVWIS
ncbi:hypothetical protein BD289DRAFT_294923 [Coniella lustricola]|uniref:Uncharacterized protein n=1 Tax=Coniella lustricola TaxID=2025994 RepID=A0A2T3A513_9PEZI|nr:hypothetical protein BD289DRAFT_294923 [Coniella lustricola]